MSSSGGGGKAEQPVVEAYSVEETTKSTTTAVEATPLTSSAENRKIVRKWAHGFCDVCYVDKEHNNKFCPYCCPCAFPFSCIMTGKLVTLYAKDEPPVCCEMDSMGTICCIGSLASVWFTAYTFCCIHAMFYRGDLIYKYNVEAEEPVCCQCFDVLYRGIFFPCSYYQMYNSIKLWESSESTAFVDDRNGPVVAGSVVGSDNKSKSK